MDLKQLSNGHYSVARGSGGVAGQDIVELDEQFREVNRFRAVGLQNTDGHDVLALPDGSRYLLAFEPNVDTGMTDAIIQHVYAAGDVLFEWDSKVMSTTPRTVVGVDGLSTSTRSTWTTATSWSTSATSSSGSRVGTEAHDVLLARRRVRKLGGRASDFTFIDTVGEPDNEPCAQPTATQAAPGDIMLFDNGAWNLSPL